MHASLTHVRVPAREHKSSDSTADLIVSLLGAALRAPSVPEAVGPMLYALTERTAAAGAAYFQAQEDVFMARSSCGVMPDSALMDDILTHGLPRETLLLRALQQAKSALFFNNTSRAVETQDFCMLGVLGLAAAPIHAPNGAFIGAFLMHTFAPHSWTKSERRLFTAVSGIMANLAVRLIAEEQTAQSYEEALHALGLALEYRDAETKGHTDRVADLALRMAAALRLRVDDATALRWGAYLHDIGKIGTPDHVLHKAGPLDSGEWLTMRQHPQIGELFAQNLSFLPPLTRACIAAHHERWDGHGYPLGLAEEAIPISARIFAICDVFDALVSYRPYKAAWTEQQALREIKAQAGKHFDPHLVDVFLSLFAPEP